MRFEQLEFIMVQNAIYENQKSRRNKRTLACP